MGREELRHYATFPGFARERARIEAWLREDRATERVKVRAP